jgi:hypothetical protein
MKRQKQINERELNLHENIKKIRIDKSDEDFFLLHDTYEPLLLSKFINRKDYDNIITEAEKIMCFSAIKKQKFEKVEIHFLVYVVLFFALFLFIFFMVILWIAVRNKKKKYNKILYYVSIGLVSFGILLLIIIEIYNNLKKIEKGKTLNDFIVKDMNVFCKKINEGLNKNICFYYDEVDEILICEVKTNEEVKDFNSSEYKSNEISVFSNRKKMTM